MKTTLVKKSSGEIVPFSSDKLKKSLQHSGANEETINTIINKIEKILYEGISTKNIYRNAFNLLKTLSKPFAAKYKLKQAIMELGPSGFPFEKYYAEILKYQGFKTSVGEFVKGKCVIHEVDIVAIKTDKYCMIECKYHNTPGINSDVKIPLYIHSRFKDIENEWLKLPEHKNKVHQGWVVTNTKFTSDAIQYGNCMGLNLISWDYPILAGLREQIDQSGLYPITCLLSITQSEKQMLLENKIVLCKEINNNPELLSLAKINSKRRSSILNEVNSLCKKDTIIS